MCNRTVKRGSRWPDKAEQKKQKKQGTIRQINPVSSNTPKLEDKALPWLCGGVFVAPIVVFVVLGVIFKWHVFSWILFMILAVMLGVLFATMMLTKRADKVGYAEFEGRPGAASKRAGRHPQGRLQLPPGTGVATDPKTKDAIWRGTGYNGIYLLGEGDYNRVKRAMDRQEQRIKGVTAGCGIPVFLPSMYVTASGARPEPASRTCASRCSSSRATGRPIARTS